MIRLSKSRSSEFWNSTRSANSFLAATSLSSLCNLASAKLSVSRWATSFCSASIFALKFRFASSIWSESFADSLLQEACASSKALLMRDSSSCCASMRCFCSSKEACASSKDLLRRDASCCRSSICVPCSATSSLSSVLAVRARASMPSCASRKATSWEAVVWSSLASSSFMSESPCWVSVCLFDTSPTCCVSLPSQSFSSELWASKRSDKATASDLEAKNLSSKSSSCFWAAAMPSAKRRESSLISRSSSMLMSFFISSILSESFCPCSVTEVRKAAMSSPTSCRDVVWEEVTWSSLAKSAFVARSSFPNSAFVSDTSCWVSFWID
mmetsp:Transcript_36858/g.85175  ORF Transcript_36858/g.85175 Transcript_36858/m.85175 type:complete len:327 (+) Transcript_36858:824-1804(+)